MNAVVTLSEPIDNFFRVEFQVKTNDTFTVTVFEPRGDTIVARRSGI